MKHTATTPESDRDGEAVSSPPVANPRRIRLGADGRPITGPVSAHGN